MAKKSRIQRKIFQMNFGYRSLMDWSPSGNWVRGSQNLYLNSFSKEGEKPPESQAKAMGMSASGSKIAGAKGFYYDVPFPTQSFDPKIFGGSHYSSARGSIADNIEEIMSELGTHTQQWLYLAAEKMAGTAQKLESETSIGKAEIKRIQMLLMHEEEAVRKATMETMKGTGKNMGGRVAANTMKFADSGDPSLVLMGLSMAKGTGQFPAGTERKKDKGWLETFDTATGLNQQTYGEKTFRKMLLGIKGQWISQFAKKVLESGEEEVQKLSDKVHKHVSDNAHLYGGKLEYNVSGKAEGIGGNVAGKKETATWVQNLGDEVESEGGSTVGEYAPIQAGIATAGKRGKHNLSLAIDIEFHKAVSVDKPRPAFRRADITTEFFGKGAHHGVGEFSVSRKVDGRKMLVELSTEDAKKEIKAFYNKDRIPKYNALMDLVMDITNEDNVFAARQSFGRRGGWAEKLGLDKDQFGKEGKKEAIDMRKMNHRLKKVIRQNVEDEIAYSIYDELFEDLKWVMHHMGNMLPGGDFDPSPYSNIMPVRLASGVSTLIIVFAIFGNGKYKKMSSKNNTSGSYIHIEETLPMQWLYQLALSRGWDGTFDEFVDMGSAAVAGHSLEGVAQSGILIRNQSASSNPDQRLIYSKLAEPEFAERLNDVSSALFEEIANNIQSTLAKDIQKRAVRYSVFSRNPRQLKEVTKWYSFAKNYLLTQAAISASSPVYGKASHEKLTTRSIALASRITENEDAPPYVDPRLIGVSHSRGLGVGQYDTDETKAWQQFSFDRGSVVHRDPYWFLWAAPYVSADWSRQGKATTGFIGE